MFLGAQTACNSMPHCPPPVMNDLHLPSLFAPSQALPPAATGDASGRAASMPSGVRWGVQTARNLHRFDIGEQRMPVEVLRAVALIKWAAALSNRELGLLGSAQATAIAQAASRVAEGEFDSQFPLSVWQTGAGSQTDMNVNEVVACIASEALDPSLSTDPLGPRLVDAAEHVNLNQPANDVFASAMHIAALLQAKSRLLPALQELRGAMAAQSGVQSGVQSVARAPLPAAGPMPQHGATPLTLGHEFCRYEAQLSLCEDAIRRALPAVHGLALGAAATGCGTGSQPSFGAKVVDRLAQRLQLPLFQAEAMFATLASHEPLVALHSALRMLAITLTQMAHGVQRMARGFGGACSHVRPAAGTLGDINLPGPMDPSAAEALAMVCVQVMGHDAAIGFAASQGHLQPNVFRPLMVLNVLDSGRLLADAMRSLLCPCAAARAP